MNEDCLKLTIYFGERDRTASGFVADALTAIYARHRLAVSLLVRGIEGFGLSSHLRTDRVLTLSEDLPLVSIAVDTRARIEAVLSEIEELRFDGLVTLERARLLTGMVERPPRLPWRSSGAATKLTVYVGRHERAGARPAYQTVVDFLRARGIAGASVLLGVDGTARGVRRRARFFGRNSQVPLMIIAVADTGGIGEIVSELAETLPAPLMTLERVTVSKRDGILLTPPTPPTPPAEGDSSGLAVWQKLMIYTSGHAQHGGMPVHAWIVRELRKAGAAGVTSLSGVWGYHGEHAPHGDSLWQLRRGAPVLTVAIDTPERIRRWFALVDEATAGGGLVTTELVPAFRATAGERRHGGLSLSPPLP